MCKSEPKQLTVVGVCRFKDGIIYDDINIFCFVCKKCACREYFFFRLDSRL